MFKLAVGSIAHWLGIPYGLKCAEASLPWNLWALSTPNYSQRWDQSFTNNTWDSTRADRFGNLLQSWVFFSLSKGWYNCIHWLDSQPCGSQLFLDGPAVWLGLQSDNKTLWWYFSEPFWWIFLTNWFYSQLHVHEMSLRSFCWEITLLVALPPDSILLESDRSTSQLVTLLSPFIHLLLCSMDLHKAFTLIIRSWELKLNFPTSLC